MARQFGHLLQEEEAVAARQFGHLLRGTSSGGSPVCHLLQEKR
jgi:hypothetical protein